MTAGEPPGAGAAAGFLLLTAIVVTAVIGLGLGLLFGVPALGALAGGVVGLGIGFWVVYSRFKDI